MDAKDYQTLHLLPTGYAKVTKRNKNCFYVKFENEKPICIRYSDTLHEDEIFLNKDLKDLRLNEEENEN